jgi:hypothetical protein
VRTIKDPTMRERVERTFIKPIINTKQKFGLGSKKNSTEKETKWTNELAEELHKPVIHHSQKRREYMKGIDRIWADDLVDMQALAK